MTYLKVQNLPGPGGEGRAILAWSMDEPEAFCDSSDDIFVSSAQRVIVAGTDRCGPHVNAPDPCPRGQRMPPECEHPVVTRPAGPDELVRCLTCGAESVPVPERMRRFVTTGPATPQAADESLDVILGDPDADHSSLLTPEAS